MTDLTKDRILSVLAGMLIVICFSVTVDVVYYQLAATKGHAMLIQNHADAINRNKSDIVTLRNLIIANQTDNKRR